MDLSNDQTHMLCKRINELEEKNKKLEETLERQGNKIDELYTEPSQAVSKFESNLALDNNNNVLV